MIKYIFSFAFFQLIYCSIFSQSDIKQSYRHSGVYFQWGYNMEAYTRSDIHFKMSNGDDFILHTAKAKNRPDYDAILEKPFEISIPQYNYRLGFYINKDHTRAFEINFDHIKYIVNDGQHVLVTGKIGGEKIDQVMTIDPISFLHFEHTDGGNLLHFNYVRFYSIDPNNEKARSILKFVWKAGAGINIPRTDFTWKGERLNNNFHIAGYNFGAEGGARLYPFRKLFLEVTSKAGFVHYLNALANTKEMKGNRASHHFGYIEGILTIGYDF
ncbi:MAG: hypothetical protein ABI844_01860 [Saprospiraceae bacterium]